MGRKLDTARLQWFEDRIFNELVPPRTVERLAGEQFGIKPRQARNYIAAVRAEWAKHRARNLEEIREELDASLHRILEKSFSDGDGRASVAAIRELKSLHGADAPAKVRLEHAGSLGLGLSIEPDPVVALERLAELRKKQGSG